jgi:hypothetical protein
LPAAGRWLFDRRPDQSNVKERFLASLRLPQPATDNQQRARLFSENYT